MNSPKLSIVIVCWNDKAVILDAIQSVIEQRCHECHGGGSAEGHVRLDTLVDLSDKQAFYRTLIDSVEPGLTHLLFHPAVNGDELAAIADTHASRHADYEAFSSGAMKDYILDAGIHLIGYRELKAYLG